VCNGNKCLLPEEALYVIRYHSFYPWHSGNTYTHLTNEKDQRMLRWVKEFQQCDLYSKSDNPEDVPDVKTLKPMYEALCTKYFPSISLRW
jgi:inositol oxygenase